MDLNKTTGNFDLHLFGSLKGYIETVIDDNSAGLNVAGVLSSAFTIASAMTAGTPASVAFGVLAGAAGIVSAVDWGIDEVAQIDGTAEAVMYRNLTVTHSNGEPGWEPFPVFEYHGAGTKGPTSLPMAKTGETLSVGDQWACFFDLESACYAKSKHPFPLGGTSIEVSSRVRAEISDLEDFLTATVTTYP